MSKEQRDQVAFWVKILGIILGVSGFFWQGGRIEQKVENIALILIEMKADSSHLREDVDRHEGLLIQHDYRLGTLERGDGGN